ncbi:hypothetical protein SAMN05192558_12068 [Actinokineospora alba]|uniref:Uncharacterized protein n=2 Tax=Actinokineospora alba TaxID=504798 RepID=A0A1H0WF27_9PSEU|nr:hypothetical protein C8E96_4490 [Actinokineospora alba]SDI75250.1 hypothetical protein SAMN05421871_107193 [Actinokineospora alba]SDP89085.1 hypothetical protein SAMN05192558_12068 [Actinokineospora alba]
MTEVRNQEAAMQDTRELVARVATPSRATAAPQALRGGGDEELRFWEVLKGITAPAEFTLVTHGRPRHALDLGAVRAG